MKKKSTQYFRRFYREIGKHPIIVKEKPVSEKMQTFWSKIWKEEKWLLDLECQKKKTRSRRTTMARHYHGRTPVGTKANKTRNP